MSSRPVPFGRGKQPLHVVPGRTDRQTFMGEDPRGHDRGGQPLAAPAASFREPEESTESRRPPLNRGPRIPRVANLLGQQFIHLGHGQRLEAKTGFLDLARETGESSDCRTRSFWGDNPRSRAIVGEFGDVIGVRLLDWWRLTATVPRMSASGRHGP